MRDRRRDVPGSRRRGRTRNSRNETSDREDKAIHPRWSGGRAHSIALRGVARTLIPEPYARTSPPPLPVPPHTHTRTEIQCRGLNLEACGCVYAVGSRDLPRKRKEKRTGRSGSWQLEPAHRAQAIVGLKMRLTIVQSAGNAPRRTSIARACVRACVRVSVGRISGIGTAGRLKIGLRKEGANRRAPR